MATSGDEQQKMEFWIHVIQDDGKENYYWLRLKAAGDEDEIGSIVKVEDSVFSASYLDSTALVGGVSVNRSIYVVGHAQEEIGAYVEDWQKRPSKQIYRLDTTNFDQGWKKLDVELITERLHPHIVVLDGKIYIFESGNYGPTPMIQPPEVYDPVEQTISMLPQEKYTSDLHLLGVDHDCKRIVFCSRLRAQLAFYSPYNEDNNKWETKEIHQDFVHSIRAVMYIIQAINHKTLYWVYENRLFAYNFEYNMVSVPVHLGFISNYTSVMPSNYELIYGYCSILFHINGDRFCFFWYREGSIYVDTTKMYCTFLKISNAYVDGHLVLVVSELATRTYNIPARGFCIRNIVPTQVS